MFLISVLVLVFQHIFATQVVVNLPGGATKCFGEQLAKHELLVIKANVEGGTSAGGSMKTINLVVYTGEDGDVKSTSRFYQVKRQMGEKVFYSEMGKKQISTASTTTTAGPYWACVENTDPRNDVDVSFSMEFGTNAQDFSQIAKKDHLEPAQVLLTKVQADLRAYHTNLQVLKNKEEVLRKTNEGTAERAIRFCLINIAIVIIVGASQMYYFKRYFRAKKII